MKTAIDRAGRIAPTKVALVRRGKAVVANPSNPLPLLTQDQVRAALEGARR